jgi:PAS domain S-box-containing protein
MSNFDASPLNLCNGDALFRQLFEKSADALFVVADGAFIDCNGAAVAMLGLAGKDQLLTRQLWEISPPAQPDGISSQQKAQQIIAQALSNGAARFEWECLRSNGESLLVEVSLTAISHNDKPILHMMWRDIGASKAVEAELKRAETTFRTILDSSSDAVFIIDPQSGAILDANHKACEMHGYTLQEFKTRGLEALVSLKAPYDMANAQEYVRLAALGEPQVFEWRSLNRIGEIIWGEVSLTRAVIAGKECVLSSTHDITERKRAEAALLRRSEQGQRFQTALVGLAKIEKTDLQAALQLITEVDSQALGVERVSVWFFDEQGTQIVCQDLYEAISRTHTYGFTLKASDYPLYFQALRGETRHRSSRCPERSSHCRVQAFLSGATGHFVHA